MNKSIDFYFDFISPYSYLAYQKMKKDKKIVFNVKPIFLGGLHNLQGITAPAFIKSKLNYMINDCILIAKKDNTVFTWNSKFPINSLDIMRGYISIDVNSKDIYLDTIFDAYWKHNLDISNKEILKSLLIKCKINTDIFFKTIKELEIKNRLKYITKEAHEKEIFGAPTFIVNDKIFWGQDRLDFALDEYNK